ncbi:MAG: choice-of-anchor Q domain-containing protein [Chloroflexota bacterium]
MRRYLCNNGRFATAVKQILSSYEIGKLGLALLLVLLFISLPSGTVYAADLATSGVESYNASNPTHVDYTIPASMSGGLILFDARGGDGGLAKITLTGVGSGSCLGPGGRGARTTARFRIGSGTNDIPVGSTIRFVVGGAGGGMEISGPIPHASSAGGAGSAVLLQKPGSSTWIELMVAGGGGGAHQAFNFPQNECTKSWGKSGTAGNDGSSGSGSGGSAGTNGNGGCSDAGSGGGGAKQPGQGDCSTANRAIDAANTDVGQMGRYDGGAGGVAANSDGRDGAYGYGGGGSTFTDTSGGGGGGGWSGGGGGAQFYGGGGGGSYICATNFAPAADLATCTVSALSPEWVSPNVAANMASEDGLIGWEFFPNSPPTVSGVPTVTLGMNEGGLAGFGGITGSDPDGDSFTMSASLGSMIDNGDGTWSWQFQTTDGPDESALVTITATDSHGATGTAQFNFLVQNVAPTVVVTGPTNVALGVIITFTYTATDPGIDMLSMADVNCGTNGTPISASFNDFTNTGSVDCIFSEGSSGRVTVQVSDSDGATGTGQFDVTLGCPSFPFNVVNEIALNVGIRCFNDAVSSGVYAMTLTTDIPLTGSTTTINNTGIGISLAINGAGYTLDGQDTIGVRPLDVASSTQVQIDNLTVTGGNMSEAGGGIRNSGALDITNSTINSNTASGGGGIYNLGTLTIDESTISNNKQGSGGGIWNASSLTITNSTFSMNTGSNGGGIYNSATGTLTVVNSTFSANSVTFQGGGLSNEGTISTIANSTFVGNSAIGVFGGGIRSIGTITVIANTIIADSPTGGNCTGLAPSTSTSNLTDSGGCWSWTNSLVPATHLGPLADNSGKTQTVALLGAVGSNSAIDNGDATTCALTAVPSRDQRGVGRPQGTACDIGAFERITLVLSGTMSASTTARLDWNDAPTGYQLWRSTSPYSGFGFLSNHDTSQADVTISPSQNYYYEVYSDMGGPSEASNRVGVFTFGIVPGN